MDRGNVYVSMSAVRQRGKSAHGTGRNRKKQSMSLTSTPEIPQWTLGLFAPKDFDNPQLLDDVLGPKLANIRHLYTNGANSLITDFARANGVSYTVVPISGGRGLPASTRDIVDASEVVVVISMPESKSSAQIAAICEAKAARDETFKWRIEHYDPVAHWRGKVGKVAEILACMDRKELADSTWAGAVWKAVS